MNTGSEAMRIATSLLLVALSGLSIHCSAADIHGRIALMDMASFAKQDSLDASLGYRNRDDLLGDLRLTWSPQWQGLDIDTAYQLSSGIGPTHALLEREGAYLPAPQPATLIDMEHTLVDRNNVYITHKIDRLSFGYSTPQYVLRIGRQALTWGSGMVFHPMDLIDPFSPTAIDTEYKPGVDMAYLQRLFADGSDLQLVAVPRAGKNHGAINSDSSTIAMHYHLPIHEINLNWLLARDYQDWTAGVGINGAWSGSSWNIEVVPTLDSRHDIRTSLLMNISAGTTLLNRNTTAFAEYFHNGFGTNKGTSLDMFPADLQERLARNQLFNVSRNYLAAGGSIEWTPLITCSLTTIVNLDDDSFFVAGELNWSLSDNATLYTGLQLPAGGKDTEYGGLPVIDHSAPYSSSPTSVYVQLRQHF